MSSTHKKNSKIKQRNISGDLNQSTTSIITDNNKQITPSNSITTNLNNTNLTSVYNNNNQSNLLAGCSSGLHTRRESFLYRNFDHREPLINIAPILANCRLNSRASSVASNDIQYVKKTN